MWYQERIEKHAHSANPKFQLCCGNGKIQLSFLNDLPVVMQKLLFESNSIESINFLQHIRTYNMMFAFTSPGAKIDNSYNNGHGPPNIRIYGQACHRIGSLLPPVGEVPRFAQLYIYETEMKFTTECNY